MAVDIQEYLDAISGDKEGEDVIIAIHDASLKLNTEAYKTADIATLLNDIKTKIFGKDIRMDIYEILKRLSESAPSPGGDVPVLNGIMGLTSSGNLSGITGMQVLNGTATLEE